MILDTLKNADRYAAAHPLLGEAIAFLRREDLAELPEGRCEIDGERIYAIVVRAEGKGRTAARLETHRRYVDVQFCLSGADVIGWSPADACTRGEGYDSEKDVEKFDDAPAAWVDLPAGTLAVLFPEDAHAPEAADGPMHKIVVKLAV